MDVAASIVGPRPGLYIVKFCQGATEIILRIIVVLLSVVTLIVSSVALDHLQDFPSSLAMGKDEEVEEMTGVNYPTLRFNSLAAGVIGIATSILCLIYETVVIILRFLNIGLINYKIKIFLAIDIVISFILSAAYGVGGVLAAYMASRWAKLTEFEFSTDNPYPSPSKSRDVLVVTAVIALISTVLTSVLMTWEMLFLIKKWNKIVIKKTAKGAVF